MDKGENFRDPVVVTTYTIYGKECNHWMTLETYKIYLELREKHARHWRKFMYRLTDEEIDKTNI